MDYDTINQLWGLIVVLVLWEMVWKGVALWKAARAGQKVWYIVLLVVNTVGILPIIYILMNRDKSSTSE